MGSSKTVSTPKHVFTPQSVSIPQSVSTPQFVSTPQSVSTLQYVASSQSVSTPQSVSKPQSVSTPQYVSVSQSVSTSQPVSTPLTIETQNSLNSQQISHPLPLNPQERMSNQIISMLDPYAQSPLMFSIPQEMHSYTYSLQQKLQATKQKLKRNNIQKIEKRINNLKSDISRLPYGRPKKSSSIKSNEFKVLQNHKSPSMKSVNQPRSDSLEFDKSSIISHKFNESTHNFGSAVEVIKLPPNNVYKKIGEATSSTQKPNKTPYDKPKVANVKQTMAELGIVMSKVKPTSTMKTTINPHNQKSVYIDLDSVVEQVRLKSTIVQNKSQEKKMISSVPLNPAMLLSSCPGLSITPIVNTKNTNHHVKEPSKSCQIQNTSTKPMSINLEQLHHLGNSLTITKAEQKLS